MDKICRFCLAISNKDVYNLQEHDILDKIRTFLTIQVSTNKSFPNQLCKECFNKISEINTFCSTLKENQEKLRHLLIDGSLEEYYVKIERNINVKDEQNHCLLFCETKQIKIEDSNNVSKIELNIDQIQDPKTANNHDKKTDESENFKQEEWSHDGCTTNCSSDDETLSSIKLEKDLNNHNIEKTSKNLHKTAKRKKIKEPQHIMEINTDLIKEFTCLSCLKTYECQMDLIKHYHTEHLKNNTEKNYKETVINGNVTYKCDNCEITFKLKKDIVKHVTVHNDERPLICKLCGRMYKMVTEIIRHARVHNGFKLQCSYQCGYTTAYRGALKEHENRHLDVYKYTCEKCGKGFHVKTWYEQHQNIHTGLKPFICGVCGLAFHMARYLTAHRSLIHPQSSSVKRYMCIHCNEKCDSANSLALHLEIHGISKDKEFLCDFCGKILSSADQLKYHHRMHSGEKPYSCSICNKTFAKKFNVKIHMNSHSGEKTHACSRCGKRYTQRSTLLRHLKRHHEGGASPKQSR